MSFPTIHASLLRALSERGYTEPTPVQAAVLQPEAADRDLLVSAQTGSGKTVAYGLAVASTLLGQVERFSPRAELLGLVIAPTRELALQVQTELTWLYAHTGARITSCVGGMDIRREQRALAQGAHIVVGTPGRLCDHMDRGHLDLARLRAVILDEADEMLDLGFREDLERILDATPAERRTLLFSATIPQGILAIARQYQNQAVRLAMSSEREPHGDIEYRVFAIAPQDRDHAVVNILRYFEVRGALVFCSTREAVKNLHGNLLERGFSVVALSGEFSQTERTRALQALRDGRVRVCVATDVAARGIDLPDLGLVIHADLPRDRETLMHRSGRTARAGRKGTSALLVPFPMRRRAERLLASASVEAAWSPPPTPEQIREREHDRLVREALALAEDPTEEDLAVVRALLGQRSPEQLAVALVRLHRGLQPAPEELSVIEPMRASGAPPRPARAHMAPGETVLYRMNIGRESNADPRWLVPFICRRGHVVKADIGRIQIFARETQFEIDKHASARFAKAVSRPSFRDRDIRIEPIRAERPRLKKAPSPHRFARKR